MRAEIQIKEHVEIFKDGWFKKREVKQYRVYPNIQFTNEEKQVLTQHDLWDATTFTWSRQLHDWEREVLGDMGQQPVTPKDLVQPTCFFSFITPGEANNFARALEEKHLPTLKGQITNSIAPGGKRVVEF